MLLCGHSAGAAPADRCDADPACARLTEQGARLAAQTSYDQALEVYERAYERSHEPRLLINIGRCHFRLGRARKALLSYQALQAELPDGEPELLERLQVFTAEARLALDADGPSKTLPLDLSAARTAEPAGVSGPNRPPLATPPADRCLADATCQQLSDQAAQLAAQTYYDRALGLYTRAYQRSQEPRLLVNIGRCYYRLGRARRALQTFYDFRKAMPAVEPEVETRVESFVTEARVSAMRDQASDFSDAEPAPAGTTVQASGGGSLLSHRVFGRPAWRVGAGLGMAGMGALMIGLGAGALAANGNCVVPSPTMMGVCTTMLRPDGQRSTLLIDGVTPGVSLLVTGGVLAIGGVVLVALPSNEKQTAWRHASGSGGAALAW